MADAFVVKRGGSGIGFIFAAISVTYPAWSVCTCTKGTKKFTAKGTSGSWIFFVPEAGTWVISCIDGSKTVTKNAVISTKNQVQEVIFSHEKVLFNAGSIDSSIGNFTANGSGGTVIENNLIQIFGGPVEANTVKFSKAFATASAGYRTLKIRVVYSGISGKFGLSSTATLPGLNTEPQWVASGNISDNISSATDFNISVSSITTNRYLTLWAHGDPSVADVILVSRIWLE